MLMRRGYMQRSCAHELLGEFIFIFFCFSFLANIIKSISSPFLLGVEPFRISRDHVRSMVDSSSCPLRHCPWQTPRPP